MGTEKNPVDAYLEKKASPFDIFRAPKPAMSAVTPMASSLHNLGQTVGAGAAHALAGSAVLGGVAALSTAAGRMYDAVTKSHDMQQMLDAHEDLRAKHQENPKEINMYFSSLRQMNPDFTKNPLIAGHFVRQMAEMGPGQAGAVLFQAGMQNIKKEPNAIHEGIMSGASEGAKASIGAGAKSMYATMGPPYGRGPTGDDDQLWKRSAASLVKMTTGNMFSLLSVKVLTSSRRLQRLTFFQRFNGTFMSSSLALALSMCW